MGVQQPIPLASTTAEQDVSGRENLINVFPRKSGGGKYPFTLKHSPGLAFYLDLPTFPVVAMHETNRRAFAVTSTTFYEIFAGGTYKELGSVDITGRAIMEDNGLQVVVVDGFKGFYYDYATNEVNELGGPGWYPAISVTSQDGYFIFDRRGTGDFFISELRAITFDPNDIANTEGKSDPLVRVLSDHRELLLFGTETIEAWFNSGDPDFPFERNQSAFIEKGCPAPYSISEYNNTVYFIGSDLMVYKLTGYTPIRISTHAVEQTLSGSDISDAYSFTFQEEGHLFYVLTLPKQELTWVYDIGTQIWHIRRSYQFGRHIANNAILFDGKTLVGDFQSGRIYQMSRSVLMDDADPIVRQFILPTISNGRAFLTIDSLELDMGSGVGTPIGQGQNPVARREFSKDGKKWSNSQKRPIGKQGEYLTRVKFNRFGAARQFIVRIRISDPVPIDIGGAWIEVR